VSDLVVSRGEWHTTGGPTELADLRRRIELLETGGGSSGALKFVVLTDPIAKAYYELGRREPGLLQTVRDPQLGEGRREIGR
jgi:hypothetical protein